MKVEIVPIIPSNDTIEPNGTSGTAKKDLS
jgi:hypothetical protein